jgi:fructokinase
MYRIGIDVGGTKIEGVLLDDDFKVLLRKRIYTNRDEGYDAIVKRTAGLIVDIRKSVSGPVSIGVGMPGSISPQTGLIRNSNTICLNNRHFDRDIEEIVGCRIRFMNDANCFAVAEAFMGAGKGAGSVFGVIMGTGVGGGLVINGKLHIGGMGIAGEWGHHILHPGGNECYCGRFGCVETYLSGPSLELLWTRLTGETKTLREIVSKEEHEAWEEWKSIFLDDFGLALSNVINIIDPQVVVLGGGVSNIDFLYKEGKDSVHRNLFTDNPSVRILRNKLGDSGGVFGAAMIGAGEQYPVPES